MICVWLLLPVVHSTSIVVCRLLFVVCVLLVGVVCRLSLKILKHDCLRFVRCSLFVVC